MNRREAIRMLGLGAAAAGLRVRAAAPDDAYAGRFFVFVQADGGWDPTSFCDPKANVRGEPEINRWARRHEIREAGGIRYAPFAANEAFFAKYHRRILVINGVDAQTNSHTVGVTHNWSGRNAAGFPTTTALLAAEHAPHMPLAYLNFGGFAATEGVARFTRVFESRTVQSVAYPNRDPADDAARSFGADDWSMLLDARTRRLQRLRDAPGLLPRQARNRRYHLASIDPAASDGLQRFADALPPDERLEPAVHHAYDGETFGSDLRRQAQIAVHAFQTGTAVSADLYLAGFDTHRNNDVNQGWLLGALVDGVDFLWEYAEEHGVADRLVVVMGSDFGRTNYYNAEDGKDHWPIGSFVVMEKNQPWTNRAVGETDGLHFPQRINPGTLARDDTAGTIIYPKHVHKALRRYLGVESSPYARPFPFDSTEDFAFFG